MSTLGLLILILGTNAGTYCVARYVFAKRLLATGFYPYVRAMETGNVATDRPVKIDIAIRDTYMPTFKKLMDLSVKHGAKQAYKERGRV